MKENQNSEAYQDDVMPIALENRTLSGVSNFAIWFACNLVVTTMLTGMYMVPDLTFGTALKVVFIGSIIGVIPLALIGVMGTKTGLVTMVLSRAVFGEKGSLLPSSVNIFILVAWSWAQAGLGGLALNYAVNYYTGFSSPALFTIITEILVVVISLYAIKGIALYEKIAMILIIVITGSVIVKAFTSIGMDLILSVPSDNVSGLTAMAAFDIVVATALSWTPMAADYNRNCKTIKGAAIGCGAGWALGTTLSMGVGALMIGMILAGNMNLTYEPSQVFGEIGFGLAGSVVIFMSVIAANVMCVYSATMSFLNVYPKPGFKKTAIVIGVICVIGALFSGILDAFLSFVNIIGVLFMPIFSIMIADFFVIKKCKYNVEAIVNPQKYKDYRYNNGVNIISMIVFVISAVIAYYLSMIHTVAIGATLPTFFIAFFLYIIAMKLFGKK
ncbi:purine-cytosine permease family protein [Anaerovorax odorimutans]|uniref:purine-cytosine permease family protein n=1 Tax=Anaerovorax odorimutans TaxID=109327 RepID=UPI0003FD3E69|nr:cytosine permease [Anaerovorax odorimutans]